MVSNVNPTDPKFIDGDDLDTEGHRHYAGVSPTEQDTAGLRSAPADEEDDTEGHTFASRSEEGDGFKAMADQGDGIMSRTDEDDTEGHRIATTADSTEGLRATDEDDPGAI